MPGYCTREIEIRITTDKKAFNRKISVLVSKLNIELRKKLVRCYVLEHCFIWLKDLDTRKLERNCLEKLRNVVLG